MPDANTVDQKPYDYRHSTPEEDRRRATEVWERVEREQRSSGSRGKEKREPKEGDEQEAAARVLQGQYRSHVHNRESQGRNLTSSQRWEDGLRKRKLSAAGREQKSGKNDPTSRWRRAGAYTEQISGGQSAADQREENGEPSVEDEMDSLGRTTKEKEKIKEERKQSKLMEGTYWLEMVDPKHRYGTNLKPYHTRWNQENTSDNFFHWLDEGGGKDLDLEGCPRHRLESEQIRYLNAAEREVYRVIVGKNGLLVWAKDGSPLDTSKYHADRGPEHGGIVEISEEEWREKERVAKEKLNEKKLNGGESPSDSSDSSLSSSDLEDEGRYGADKGGTKGQGKGMKQFKNRLKYYTSPKAVMDTMLRGTLNRNTWIFVSSLSNDLYVGIKSTGQFQHSSFLYGARVSAAGLIKASHGQLTSLSPLSGHYRAGTQHFKAFVRSLEEQGVDMSHVSISKSVLTIRGIEKMGAVSKKKKHLEEKLKAVFTHSASPEEKNAQSDADDASRIRSEEHNEGQAAHKDEVEHGEKKMKEEKEEDDEPLPGEGKSIEDMTEEERMERGVALVQRAFEKGLKLE